MARQHCTLTIDPDIYSMFVQKYRGKVSYMIGQYMEQVLNIDIPDEEMNVDKIEKEIFELDRKIQQERILKKALEMKRADGLKDQAQKEKELFVLQEKQKKLKVEDFELYNSLDSYDQTKVKVSYLEAIKAGKVSSDITVSDYYVNIYSKEDRR